MKTKSYHPIKIGNLKWDTLGFESFKMAILISPSLIMCYMVCVYQ